MALDLPDLYSTRASLKHYLYHDLACLVLSYAAQLPIQSRDPGINDFADVFIRPSSGLPLLIHHQEDDFRVYEVASDLSVREVDRYEALKEEKFFTAGTSMRYHVGRGRYDDIPTRLWSELKLPEDDSYRPSCSSDGSLGLLVWKNTFYFGVVGARSRVGPVHSIPLPVGVDATSIIGIRGCILLSGPETSACLILCCANDTKATIKSQKDHSYSSIWYIEVNTPNWSRSEWRQIAILDTQGSGEVSLDMDPKERVVWVWDTNNLYRVPVDRWGLFSPTAFQPPVLEYGSDRVQSGQPLLLVPAKRKHPRQI